MFKKYKILNKLRVKKPRIKYKRMDNKEKPAS